MDVVTVVSKCMCVNKSCSKIDANSANHCYMGHNRPQAKSLLVDLKLQGFINQIMSRVRSSKLNRRLVFTSARYSGTYILSNYTLNTTTTRLSEACCLYPLKYLFYLLAAVTETHLSDMVSLYFLKTSTVMFSKPMLECTTGLFILFAILLQIS